MVFRLGFLAILILFQHSIAQAKPFSEIKSFAYQLQDLNIEEVAASNFDLIVMDYSKDGTDEQRYTTEEILKIKGSGQNEKIILSYFSIGEAEDYRYYFKSSWIQKSSSAACGKKRSVSAPSWLDQSNKNWCGNYKVKYWQRAWKKIIFKYLDKIIDAGFDGVYLDIIDGFEYWKYSKKPKSERRKSAPKDMAKFVVEIANYARITKDRLNFIVVPQNGSSIIEEIPAELKERYLSAINGIGAEDTFFFGDRDEDNDLNQQDFAIKYLDAFRAAGKVVLSLDYLSDPTKIAQFKDLACSRNYIPQVSNRPLNSLQTHLLNGCN